MIIEVAIRILQKRKRKRKERSISRAILLTLSLARDESSVLSRTEGRKKGRAMMDAR